MDKKEYITARTQYIDVIKTELLGPGSEISIPDCEHELITNSPDTRYSIGVLFPKNNRMNADNNDTARIEEDIIIEDAQDLEDANEDIREQEHKESETDNFIEDSFDEEVGLATQNMPSSMGITFLVSNDIKELNCDVQFATYIRAKANDCRVPFYPENPDKYVLPQFVTQFVYFDKVESTLRLKIGGFKKKDVRALKEKDLLDGEEFGLFSAMYKLCDQLQSGFVRVPHNLSICIDFAEGDYVDSNRQLDETSAKVTALKRKIDNGLYSITLMLVNDEVEKSNGTKCIFQPVVNVSTKNNKFTFCEYSRMLDFSQISDEEQSLELQYRNKKVYGTGLGTSVNWEINEYGEGCIFNDFFPEVEVPAMDFNIDEKYDVSKKALSMKFLSDLVDMPQEEKLCELQSLVDAYKTWIGELDEKSNKLDDKFFDIAKKNLEGCKKAYARMDQGLQILKSDGNAWNAFLLANRAMFMQRVHLKLQADTSAIDRYPGDEDLGELLENIDYKKDDGLTKDNYFWRPFQITFILMSVGSIVDDKAEDRDLVDLIWFPTGGGKTEAYLLLTAFTIFYRRLAYSQDSDGTSVIMRYTLRLLAAQQFTRASTLICACECIREDAALLRPKYGKKYNLGTNEISIGLWIGSDHTPNTNEDAKENLKKLLDSNINNLEFNKEKYNKFQVLKCPWCGTKMVKDRNGGRMHGTFGYRMKNNRHFQLFCPHEKCHFNERGALPIQVIDQELYENPPTLLFGTVDKFAMLPWNVSIGNFMGINNRNRAPELIIQDELHLISGPLGTMVGLYESVIDFLCKHNGVSPKIIASTATIRRANEQCAALYNRKVSQFPHPGLDVEDSFFAREAIVNHDLGEYGRSYIGLMPSGKTKAMMEIRSMAALLQKIHTMDLTDEVKDKLWTLTVYFNSLKDLGKCSTLVDDDIKDFIKRMAYRLGTAKDARLIGSADELTSRVATIQLNETLDKLEKVVYSKENLADKRYPTNVLLATNMISVGIDIARLNVMLLVGQPKLTSEYIQASSRVGRSYPGVAFVMYDGSKSRDRSHFEQFKAYHESFYKYVEPTSATPFSKPARARALHAIVIAMMRLMEDDLANNQDAALFNVDKYRTSVDRIKNYIIKRAVDITHRLNAVMDDDAQDIAGEIETIFEKWQRLAENYGEDKFFYMEKNSNAPLNADEGRLMKLFNTKPSDEAFDTMKSMRNVDASIQGSIIIWEDN